MKVRIATWNVAGGRRIKSLERFDYVENEDLEYFRSELEKLNLDIICLQESQFNDSDSFAKRLASSLGMTSVAETPGCPSHIDKNYKMTPAILSTLPYISSEYSLLPYPEFQLRREDKVFPPYDRYLLQVGFDDFSVATTHTEPLGQMFDMTYESGEGNSLAKSIDELIVAKLHAPVILAADLNFENVAGTLPKSTLGLKLSEALPEVATTPGGARQDNVSCSDDFTVIDSGIVKTETDHYLCWAELEGYGR